MPSTDSPRNQRSSRPAIIRVVVRIRRRKKGLGARFDQARTPHRDRWSDKWRSLGLALTVAGITSLVVWEGAVQTVNTGVAKRADAFGWPFYVTVAIVVIGIYALLGSVWDAVPLPGRRAADERDLGGIFEGFTSSEARIANAVELLAKSVEGALELLERRFGADDQDGDQS